MNSDFPSSSKLIKLASICTVTDQRTGKPVPFIPLEEQRSIFETINDDRNIVFLKGRQIGCSMAICFLDAMYAFLHSGSFVAVVADTEQKCHGLLDRVRNFLTQLRVQTSISNRSRIKLSNGSEIHALTANASKGQEESKAGRSMSYQMLHLSELAFWPDQKAFGALTASAGLSAPIIIESTSSGPGDLLWHLWHNNNNFRKVFFSIESHSAYRADGDLPDDLLEQGRELGFTDPRAMRWFFTVLENRFSGDIFRCLREYPQRPEHAFQSAEGRWIHVTPPVLEHSLEREIKVFRPRSSATKYSVGVDTSGGIGQDASTIVVLDRMDGSLMASYHSQEDTIDLLSSKIRAAYEIFGPDHVCVEVNGIGLATAQAARDKGVPVMEVKTTDASRYSGLLMAKNAVESGIISGPIELAEECDSLHIDNRERFAGKKDLCMAIGFALEDIRRNPLITVSEKKEGVFDMNRFLTKKKDW